MPNVLTCFLALGWGSIVDVLMNECNASMVNAFRIEQLSSGSNHIATHTHQWIKVQDDNR